MHILLSNDDGVEAPGLTALYRAMDSKHRITVVAPDGERSSCGHSVHLNDDIAVCKRRVEPFGDVFAVAGTPADCVRLAIAELAGESIDWVFSGINLGANVSVVDAHCSGTLAAAREAAFTGIRAAAFSQMFRKGQPVDWARSTKIVADLVQRLTSQEISDGTFWSCNLPALAAGQAGRGVQVLPLSPDHIPLVFERRAGDSDSANTYRYAGYYEGRASRPGCDVAAVFDGYVVLTPLRVDQTDYTQCPPAD